MITTTINWQTKVLDVNVNINYSFSNGVAPTQMSVYSNWNGNGVSSNMNRNYTPDGEYTPVPSFEVYPFTTEFDTALAAVIVEAFINYLQPEVQ